MTLKLQIWIFIKLLKLYMIYSIKEWKNNKVPWPVTTQEVNLRYAASAKLSSAEWTTDWKPEIDSCRELQNSCRSLITWGVLRGMSGSRSTSSRVLLLSTSLSTFLSDNAKPFKELVAAKSTLWMLKICFSGVYPTKHSF